MKRSILPAAFAAIVLPGAVQAATHQVAALSDLAGVNKALLVKAGDTVSLPAFPEGSYKVTNARYASLGQDGATLTILEPGLLGVQQLAADGVTLQRGTWGATGSGAEHIDDAHFAGAGVLTVARDELTRPLLIMMK